MQMNMIEQSISQRIRIRTHFLDTWLLIAISRLTLKSQLGGIYV